MTYTAQEMPPAGSTVLVGMSGGVDSTLTAILLKKRGCRVIGVTMSLYDENFFSKESAAPQKKYLSKHAREACFGPGEKQNIEECKKFCAANGIEYYVVDVKQQYKEKVLEYFKSEYRAGRTPNPCVMCNQNIKFGALLEQASALGIEYDYFCTGHYAKIVRPDSGVFGTSEQPFMVANADDALKDQTYFLNRIPSSVLQKVRFPLATMKKSDVVALAKAQKLDAANREESQDFVGQEYFDELFSDKESVPGDIIDLDGRVLGRHKGIEHYTVGQRRGLGVAVNYPVYVHSIDAKNNLVVLAPEDALFSNALIAENFVWPGNIEPREPFEAMVKIRLASRPVLCKAESVENPQSIEPRASISNSCAMPNGTDTLWRISFSEPQRAVAPGQAAVLYDNGAIIGGGIISKAIG